MEISGHCDDRFSRVREEFEKNFTDRGDIGASFALTLEGEYVIDLWGGHQDAARTRPWLEDTIINVFSTTKTMTALSALILLDRGDLDVERCIVQANSRDERFAGVEVPLEFENAVVLRA